MSTGFQPYTSTRSRAAVRDEFQTLRSRLEGQLITAAHADFDTARSVRYINIDRRPLAVVRAASAQDVAAAVCFAAERDLPLAVRSGGHSLAYYFLEEEGPDRVRDAYPPATFARLVELKRKYDPQNMFRFNQNIPRQV